VDAAGPGADPASGEGVCWVSRSGARSVTPPP